MADAVADQEIRDLYDAFNRRDSSFVTERMTSDVSWPRAFKGGFVHGPDAVRSYWEEQWQEIDPHVEPVAIERREDGRFVVEVRQIVKDLSGTVIADSTVHHVYRFDGPMIAGMDVRADE